MDYNSVRQAFEEAEAVQNRAEHCAKIAVEFSAGRLRRMNLSQRALRKLKQELNSFNARSGKWNPR